MNDRNDHHEPTAEFRASLEREIARTLRNEAQFRGVPPTIRPRRLGMLIGLPVGALATLLIGFALGTSTSYASAAMPNSPSHTVTAGNMMRNALTVLTCGAVAMTPVPAPAQQGVPVVDLPMPVIRSRENFGAILGLRQGADGNVLVNDAGRRFMKLLDSTLTTSATVMDSTAGSSMSYGSRPTTLVPFVGDSSLFADWKARTMLVLDGHGKTARALALPNARDIGGLNLPSAGVDGKGRLIYRGSRTPARGDEAMRLGYGDSIPVVRVDLDTRATDTIARVARPLMRLSTAKGSDGAITNYYVADPLQPLDEWSVLSNGTVAFVRGHDYHVDFISADGTLTSSAKLPFEWKRIADDNKQRLSDSIRANPLLPDGSLPVEITTKAPTPCGRNPLGGDDGVARSGGARGGGSGDGPPPSTDMSCTQVLMGFSALSLNRAGTFPPIAELSRSNPIADYLPPIGVTSTMPDADGNLWILPRTSSLSQKGELVYDIVNGKGVLFERVRLPLGRAIAGFGKGGVVYLMHGDRTNGFYLERVTLTGASSSAKQ